jgi:hypothetical protein
MDDKVCLLSRVRAEDLDHGSTKRAVRKDRARHHPPPQGIMVATWPQ